MLIRSNIVHINEQFTKIDTCLQSEKYFSYFCFLTSFIFVLVIAIRAAGSGITYDEAYTYLHYAKANHFNTPFCPNNHILNTLLINWIDRLAGVQFNEFLIRLPNVLFGICYCLFACKLANCFKYRYLIVSLCFFNSYISDFFSMARGYGIACACIMACCYFIKGAIGSQNSYKNFYYFILFACLANLANGISLYITASMLLIMLWNFRNKIRDEYRLRAAIGIYIVIATAVALFTLFASTRVTPYATHSFCSFLLSSEEGLVPQSLYLYAYVAMLLPVVFGLFRKTPNYYFFIYLIFIIFAYLSNLILAKGYPLGREMIPVYPVFIMAVASGLEHLPARTYLRKASLLLSLVIGLNFAFNTSLSDITCSDFRQYAPVKNRIFHYAFNNDIQTNDKQFSDFAHKDEDATAIFYYYKIHYLKNK